MSKVYKTFDGLVRAAKKDGYYIIDPHAENFSVNLYKTGCDSVLFIKQVGRWVKQ